METPSFERKENREKFEDRLEIYKKIKEENLERFEEVSRMVSRMCDELDYSYQDDDHGSSLSSIPKNLTDVEKRKYITDNIKSILSENVKSREELVVLCAVCFDLYSHWMLRDLRDFGLTTKEFADALEIVDPERGSKENGYSSYGYRHLMYHLPYFEGDPELQDRVERSMKIGGISSPLHVLKRKEGRNIIPQTLLDGLSQNKVVEWLKNAIKGGAYDNTSDWDSLIELRDITIASGWGLDNLKEYIENVKEETESTDRKKCLGDVLTRLSIK